MVGVRAKRITNAKLTAIKSAQALFVPDRPNAVAWDSTLNAFIAVTYGVGNRARVLTCPTGSFNPTNWSVVASLPADTTFRQPEFLAGDGAGTYMFWDAQNRIPYTINTTSWVVTAVNNFPSRYTTATTVTVNGIRWNGSAWVIYGGSLESGTWQPMLMFGTVSGGTWTWTSRAVGIPSSWKVTAYSFIDSATYVSIRNWNGYTSYTYYTTDFVSWTNQSPSYSNSTTDSYEASDYATDGINYAQAILKKVTDGSNNILSVSVFFRYRTGVHTWTTSSSSITLSNSDFTNQKFLQYLNGSWVLVAGGKIRISSTLLGLLTAPVVSTHYPSGTNISYLAYGNGVWIGPSGYTDGRNQTGLMYTTDITNQYMFNDIVYPYKPREIIVNTDSGDTYFANSSGGLRYASADLNDKFDTWQVRMLPYDTYANNFNDPSGSGSFLQANGANSGAITSTSYNTAFGYSMNPVTPTYDVGKYGNSAVGDSQTLVGTYGTTLGVWHPNGRFLTLKSNSTANNPTNTNGIISWDVTSNTYTNIYSTGSLLGGCGTWSSDGRYLALGFVGGANNRLHVIDFSTTTPVRLATPATVPNNITGLCFSPDNRYLVVTGSYSAGVDAALTIYDMFLGNLNTSVAITSPPTVSSNACGWSPDGKFLVIGNAATTYANFYSFLTGVPVLMANPATLPTGAVNDISWSPNSRYCALAHDSTPFISVYDYNTGSPVKLANPATLPTQRGASVTWSKNGRFLHICQGVSPGNGKILTYDISSGALVLSTAFTDVGLSVGGRIGFNRTEKYFSVVDYDGGTGAGTLVKIYDMINPTPGRSIPNLPDQDRFHAFIKQETTL